MPHRFRVFKTRVLCKKNFTYSGVFNPYSDVFNPYSGVFLQFMKIKFLKLDFNTHPLINRDLKTRVLNNRHTSFQHYFNTWQLIKFFLYLLLFGKDDRSLSDTVSGETLKSKNTIRGRNSEGTNPQSKISNWSKRQWNSKAVSLSKSLSNLLKGPVGREQSNLQLFFLRGLSLAEVVEEERRCWRASMPHCFPTLSTGEENKKGQFFFF